MTFLEGTTTLGQVAVDANGQATISAASLATGPHSITVSYSGDSKFAAGTSTALTVSVVDFQLSLPNASQTVASGASATYSVTATGVAGITGTLSLSCSGLPAGYSCASMSIALGAQPATANLTVTPAKAALLPFSPFHERRGEVVLALLPFALLVRSWRSRTVRLLALLVLSCAASLAVTGCSGGTSGAAAKPYTGTSSFTITATANVGMQTLSHQATATLIVQ